MVSNKIQKSLMLSSLRKVKWLDDPDKKYWGSNEEIFTERLNTKLISEIMGFDIINANNSFIWSQTLKAGYVLNIIDANIEQLIKHANLNTDNQKVYIVVFADLGLTAFKIDDGSVEIKLLNDCSSLEDMTSIEVVPESNYQDENVIHTPLIDIFNILDVGNISYTQVKSKISHEKSVCLAIRVN
jgi:hypothetical protein